MSTVVQLEEGNFNNGLLPPLRELFLEIQVNKLIQDYLFSSNADERCTSLHDGSSEYKENKAGFLPADQFYATDAALRSACNAQCVKFTEALDYHKKQSPHDPHSLYKSTSAVNDLHMQTTQESLTLHSLTCIEDKGISKKDQMVMGNALQAAQTAQQASLATLSVENESKLMNKTAHLSRVDTFPCTSKIQGMPSKANTEIKASFKKPPRPPRLPKSELSASLTRCCSDNGAYLQSLRRAKLDRKRKATATSGVNTSIWALLFTFCFAIIMIAQGFWSEGSQNFTTHGSGASSPMETFMKASTKGSPEEASLAGAANRQASAESVLAESYVMRKVQSQHLSDMKHLQLDTFPKS